MPLLTNRIIRSALLLVTFYLCDHQIARAEPQTVTVNDPRPVAKAIELLERDFGLPITYEDPLYIHGSEMVDVTSDVRLVPKATRIMIPRGLAFSFTYDAPSKRPSPSKQAAPPLQTEGDGSARKAAAAKAITQALSGYAVLRGANAFSVVQDKGLLHVVPTQFTNSSGRVETAKPLLNTAVSIFPKQRTGAVFLNEVCQSLSSTTGQKVVLGTIPTSLLMTRTTSITATSEPARTVISRFFAEFPEALSWRLLYDPGLRWYVLNIHVVRSSLR